MKGDLPIHGVRFCSTRPIPAFVQAGEGRKGERLFVPTGAPGLIQIKKLADGTHGYSGLARCASALVCPVCGAIIAARRGQEVAQATEVLLSRGYNVAMLTLTAKHTARDSLKSIVKRWRNAERYMRSHRRWKNFAKEYGLDYHIRAVEITYDAPWIPEEARSGWHFHCHYILYFKADIEGKQEQIEEIIANNWIDALKKQGLSGKRKDKSGKSVVCSLHIPKKNKGDSIEKIVKYICKGVAFEITGTRFKKGRDEKSGRSRRISVWEMQRIALEEYNKPLLKAYGEYMKAIKGVNWLRFSPGLRQAVDMRAMTDKELIEENKAAGEVIAEFGAKDFAPIAAAGAQGLLLSAADEGGPAAVWELVAALQGGPPYQPPD